MVNEDEFVFDEDDDDDDESSSIEATEDGGVERLELSDCPMYPMTPIV